MLVKVCGLCQAVQAQYLSSRGADFVGFIFHAASPRYVGHLQAIASKGSAARVGVFYNHSEKEILSLAKDWQLNYLQLHGQESPELALRLKEAGYRIIKAFGIFDAKDFNRCAEFQHCCDALLFDYKTPKGGGSGQCFDWRLLQAYQGRIPYILSGGIDSSSLETIAELAASDNRLLAVDINSRFELQAGVKDLEKTISFIHQLKKICSK